jgi:periplasmic protein TonB
MSYAQPKSSSRRLTALVAVGVLHVLLIYALFHGLARKIVEVVRPPLETKIIEEVKRPPPEQPPPPPPPPKLAPPPPPFIPPPEVRVQVPVQPPPTITAVTPTPPPEPVPPPAAPVVIAPPAPAPPAPMRTGASANCPQPPYPAAARRAGETGLVRMSVLIEANGRLTDSKVDRSSGSRRLDDAAKEGLSQCRPRPATVDGRPQPAWVIVEFNFNLRD